MAIPNNSTNNEGPRTSVLFLVVVSGIILLRIFQRNTGVTDALKSPGPERGDITLSDGVLPQEVGNWEKHSFTPAPDPGTLTPGTVAWSHAWLFRTPELTARVAFDQAHFVYWHELTVCYEAIDWVTVSRRVEQSADQWPFVIAKMKNPAGHHAIVLFSLFDDQARPANPPETFNIDNTTDLVGKLTQRLTHERTELPKRLLQSQVFAETKQSPSAEEVQSLTKLHLETREAFRMEWLRKKRRPGQQRSTVTLPSCHRCDSRRPDPDCPMTPNTNVDKITGHSFNISLHPVQC